MSASPMARQAVESGAIPIEKKVVVDDPADLPSELSSTPGGTLFSTTPGGTKIVYEKSVLMSLRNSPISKTPPSINIPEQLLPGTPNNKPQNPKKSSKSSPNPNKQKKNLDSADDQFQIDL